MITLIYIKICHFLVIRRITQGLLTKGRMPIKKGKTPEACRSPFTRTGSPPRGAIEALLTAVTYFKSWMAMARIWNPHRQM